MDESQGNNTNLKLTSNFFHDDGGNEIDDQSFAFQNLINLNKNKTMNENINLFGTINIYDKYNDKNKIKNKKNLDKSEDKRKFYLKESKQYFNEDKKVKENNNRRKYSDIMKTNFKLDIVNDKKNEDSSLKFGKTGKNKILLEYDGDIETITFRYDYNEQIEIKNTLENIVLLIFIYIFLVKNKII